MDGKIAGMVDGMVAGLIAGLVVAMVARKLEAITVGKSLRLMASYVSVFVSNVSVLVF
jgi:hypothetical protein